MNAEVKEKWVAALKSGEYQQTTCTLKDSNGYCCLGVLCDLYIKEHANVSWDTEVPLYLSSSFKSKLSTWGELPDMIMDWAEIYASDPVIGGDSAVVWNDEHCATFEKIAELIEVHL